MRTYIRVKTGNRVCEVNYDKENLKKLLEHKDAPAKLLREMVEAVERK